MRKFFRITFIMILILGLSGCSGDDNTEKAEKKSNYIDENDRARIYKYSENGNMYYGLSDRSGKIVVDCVFDKLEYYYDNNYGYSKDGEVGILNSEGEILYKQKGTDIQYVNDYNNTDVRFIAVSDDMTVLLDDSTAELIRMQGNYLGRAPHTNYIFLERSDRVGVIDFEGNAVIPFTYESIYYIENSPGTFQICNETNCTLMDKNLKQIATGLTKPIEEDRVDLVITSMLTKYNEHSDSYKIFKNNNTMVISADGQKQTINVTEKSKYFGNPIDLDDRNTIVFDEDNRKTIYYDSYLNEVFSIDGKASAFSGGLACSNQLDSTGYFGKTEKIINEKGEVILESNTEYTNLSVEYGYILATDLTGTVHYVLDQNLNKIFESTGDDVQVSIAKYQDKEYIVYRDLNTDIYNTSFSLYNLDGSHFLDSKGSISFDENSPYILSLAIGEDDLLIYLYDENGNPIINGMKGSIDQNSYEDVIIVSDYERNISILYDAKSMQVISQTQEGYFYVI